MERLKRSSRRTATGIVGSAVLLIGIICIPYPGPGWLIVFAGLAILAREFTWAQRVLVFLRQKYDRWQEWILRQPTIVKAVFFLLTTIVVIVTIWLLNGYGLLNDWFNLGIDWAQSPLI